MKANNLEELVTDSNIIGELRNYTDWYTRLVKFAQLVADWQYQKDREEFAKIKAKGWCEGYDALKKQMLEMCVSQLQQIRNCNPLDTPEENIGYKVRIVVPKEGEE